MRVLRFLRLVPSREVERVRLVVQRREYWSIRVLKMTLGRREVREDRFRRRLRDQRTVEKGIARQHVFRGGDNKDAQLTVRHSGQQKPG